MVSGAFRAHSYTALPLELIIAIIEELAAERDNRTLCAFSLVCSSLVPICRKHIFHSFDMRTGSQCTRGWQIVNKFAKFLSQNLHLTPYFRTVHILALGKNWPLPSWIYETPSLAYIIRHLTSLHTFELIVSPRSAWDLLPTNLKEAFFVMVCRNNLQTLRFTGMTDIPLLLFTQASRHLKSFHAHQVACWHIGRLPAVGQRHKRIFEELSLGHSTLLLRILLENAYFDLSSLQKITIDISSKPTNLKLSWSLIARAGESLRHLEFRQSEMEHDPRFFCFKNSGTTPRLLPFITLQPHTALQSFSFTVVFMGHPEEYLLPGYGSFDDDPSEPEPIPPEIFVQHFLPWCQLLRTAPASLRLVTITLDCYGLHNQALRKWFDISNSSKWSDLDLILANSECLPLLRKVIFYVNLPDSENSDSDYNSDGGDALLSESDDESNVHDGCHTGWDEEDTLDDDSESNAYDSCCISDLEVPLLSFEEAAYFIRRNMKLTRRLAIVEVLAGD